MFIWKDVDIYDEFYDETPGMTIGTGRGLAKMIQDCFAYFMKNQERTNEEIAALYRVRQTIADKRTGSGENIIHGDRLFAYPKTAGIAFTISQDWEVSPIATGTIGTDYLFCGWAKEDAGENEDEVLMNFDGTRPEIGY